MRIALFVTCLADTLYPRGRARPRCGCWSGSATRWCSPPPRPAAGRCTSTPATARGAAAGPPLRRDVRATTRRSWRRPARAPARSGTSTRWWPGGSATTTWRAAPRPWPAGPTSCRSCWSTCSGSRTSAPTTRTGSPTTRPATRCGCCGSATGRCGCCATCAGIDLVELPDAEVCCGFGGTFAVKNADVSTAMLADKMRNVLDHRRRGLHRRRQLLPDAHRRRAVPAADRASGPCTWPRSSPRPGTRHEHVPRPADRAAAASGTCAATSRSRSRRAGALADTQLRRNLGQATATIRAKRAARRRRAARLGGAARGRPGDQGRDDGPPRRATWSSWRARSPRAAGPCTGPGTPSRPTGSSPTWSGRPAPTEVVKVKSMATQEIGLNEALGAGRHRRRTRPTWPS